MTDATITYTDGRTLPFIMFGAVREGAGGPVGAAEGRSGRRRAGRGGGGPVGAAEGRSGRRRAGRGGGGLSG